MTDGYQNGQESPFNNFANEIETASTVAARFRKMTMQEDSAVCESIVTMPKTPYLRYFLFRGSNRLDRARGSQPRSPTSSCLALSTWKITPRGPSSRSSLPISSWVLRSVMILTRAASTSPLKSKGLWSLGSKCFLNAKADKKSVQYRRTLSTSAHSPLNNSQTSSISVLRSRWMKSRL